MSANVWFEEVSTGLIDEIRDSVRIKDYKGDLVPLEHEKAIIIRKPEEDFKFEVFPCVSIYNVSYKHDKVRYNPAPVVVDRIPESNIAIVEDSAIPFNLEYQIDFWARYQEDMDLMTKTWLSSHFRQFNLKVIDDGGTPRTCNCLMQGSVVKSDLVLGGERLFHSIVKLLIWVELDNETRYNKFISTHLDIDVADTSED